MPHILNVHFNASKLNPVLPSAIALHGIKRGRARLQRHHVRDECSPWWDIHSPHGPLPPAAPRNITARIGYPPHAPAAQRSRQKQGFWECQKPPCSKVFWGSRKRETCQQHYSNCQFLLPHSFHFLFSILHSLLSQTMLLSNPAQIPNSQPFPPAQTQAAPSQKPNFCSHSPMKNLTKTELFLFLTMDSIAWELKSHLGSTLIRLFENITQNLSKIANTKVREAGMVRRRE